MVWEGDHVDFGTFRADDQDDSPGYNSDTLMEVNPSDLPPVVPVPLAARPTSLGPPPIAVRKCTKAIDPAWAPCPGFVVVSPEWACVQCLAKSAGTCAPVCAMNPARLSTACDTPGTSCSECSFQASAITSAQLDLFRVPVLSTMPGDRTSADLGSLQDCLREVALDLAHNASVPPARRALALGQLELSADAAGFSAEEAGLSYPRDPRDSCTTANPQIPWVPYRVVSAPDAPCPVPRTIDGSALVVSSADTAVISAGVRVWHEGSICVVPPSSIVLSGTLACARCAHYGLVCEAPDGMLSCANQRNCCPCARVPTRICSHNKLWDRVAQRGRHLAQMVLDFAAWVLGHASRPGSASKITWSTFLQAVLMGRWSDLGAVPPVPVSDSDVLESWGRLRASWDAHPWMLEAPPHTALGVVPTRQDLGSAPQVEVAELDG
jgi:hypothetical protein